jgi:hypothetical protein
MGRFPLSCTSALFRTMTSARSQLNPAQGVAIASASPQRRRSTRSAATTFSGHRARHHPASHRGRAAAIRRTPAADRPAPAPKSANDRVHRASLLLTITRLLTYQLGPLDQPLPAGAEAALREVIEDRTGALVRWHVRRLTPGREDIPTSGKSITYPGLGESSSQLELGPTARLLRPSSDLSEPQKEPRQSSGAEFEEEIVVPTRKGRQEPALPLQCRVGRISCYCRHPSGSARTARCPGSASG